MVKSLVGIGHGDPRDTTVPAVASRQITNASRLTSGNIASENKMFAKIQRRLFSCVWRNEFNECRNQLLLFKYYFVYKIICRTDLKKFPSSHDGD